MARKRWYLPPFTRHDRLLSIIGMTIGATMLTLMSYSDSTFRELLISTHMGDNWVFAMKCIACAIWGISVLWMLATSKRQRLPVWNLLYYGNLYGGGCFGLSIYTFGTSVVARNLACAAWGWIVGFVVFIWGKKWCDDEEGEEKEKKKREGERGNDEESGRGGSEMRTGDIHT